MKKLVIDGGKELSGKLRISGAKNSVVALIPAAMLTKGKVTIKNVPDLSDVHALIDIMKTLGSNITFENETITIDNKNINNRAIKEELSTRLRASYYFMGSLLGMFNKAEIAFPGGCIIGSRPIDIHLKCFKKMGATISEKNNVFTITAKKLTGDVLYFDFPSVGATINMMLASVLAEGKTTIINAAQEPEIVNVASLLNSMGAHVLGAGTSKIEIIGVKELHDGSVEVIPDRIEAGTYLIMGALLGKNFTITDVIVDHILPLIEKLEEAGVKMKICKDSITVSKSKKLNAVNIKTTVYPGFPTDLGQPMSTFLTQCEGESFFEETIYENRLRHIPHLKNMGANIRAFNKTAVISGATKLKGRKVIATDLRAGASMLVAGMIAEGTTTISNIEHILRGYEKIVDKLVQVGASIKLVDE